MTFKKKNRSIGTWKDGSESKITCQRIKQDLEETGPSTSIVNNRKGPALILYFYKIQNLLPREWCHPEWESLHISINVVKITPTPDMFRGISLK